MANKSDLIRRGNQWYFNKAYPKDLWPVVGRSPFRMSLRTDSFDVAIRSRPDADRLYWAKVDQLRAKHAPKEPKGLTEVQAMGIVARWFREEDAERTAELEDNRSPLQDIDGALAEIDALDIQAREAIAEDEFYRVQNLAEKLAEDAGYTFDPRPKASKRYLRALLRGRRQLLLMERSRLLGDYTVEPSDPLLRSILADQPHSGTAARTVKDMVEGFLKDNRERWGPSTLKGTEAPLRILQEFLGPDCDLASIRREDGRALYELIRGLPVNYTKRKELKGLSLPQCVEKGAKLGLKTLAPKSVNDTYMTFIGGAFRWAVREGWMTLNPVDGLTATEDTADVDKRSPFTTAQLNELFRSGPWGEPSDTREADPLRYWGPLVGLFQGMRRGEIAQLGIDDVAVEDGVPVIHIRPSADGKRVKSAAGRRTLPVHPELVKLGFLSYVHRQRSYGHQQVFPNEQPNKSGHWGDPMGKWFSRHVEALGFEGAKLGMHSFRHNFEDALRRADLHGTPLGQEIAGRAKADRVSGAYGTGRHPIEKLKDAVERVGYPGVNLGHLYPKMS